MNTFKDFKKSWFDIYVVTYRRSDKDKIKELKNRLYSHTEFITSDLDNMWSEIVRKAESEVDFKWIENLIN